MSANWPGGSGPGPGFWPGNQNPGAGFPDRAEGAWWEKQRREEAEAQRRRLEDAHRRADEVASQRRTRQRGNPYGSQPDGWRPTEETHGRRAESASHRALRLALYAILVVAGLAFLVDWGQGGLSLLAAIVGVPAFIALAYVEQGKREAERRTGIATHVVVLPGSGKTPSLLSFRLERHDSRGARLTPTPVEMKGGRIKGQLLDGDEIRVVGGRASGGALHPKELVNLRTGERVRMSGRVGHWLGTGIAWLPWVAIALFILVVLLQ